MKYIYRFNIYFLFGFKYVYLYKYYISFPVLIPRSDSIFCISFLFNLFNFFFMPNILDLGFGSGIFSYIFYLSKKIDIFCVDLIFFSFFVFFKNLFKGYFLFLFIFNSDWYYLLMSVKFFNLIFINPPYLSYDEIDYFFSNYVVEYKRALTAKYYGFLDFFFLLRELYDSLYFNGFLFVEHSYSQSKCIRIAMYRVGFSNVFTYYFNNIYIFTIAEK